MKNEVILFVLIMVMLSNKSFCQGGIWTWINGGDSIMCPPNYGVKGVPNKANNPGGIWNAANWIDREGNLWLFGGMRDSAKSGYSRLADLWRYEPMTDLWTWMNGPGITNPVPSYGSKGVASPLNNPGRGNQSYCSWIHKNNSLWLYTIDDQTGSFSLWSYSISSNEWTWINSSKDKLRNRPVYGVLQAADSTNCPGSRWGALCWTDNNGKLWLYGGGGSVDSLYNDVWYYDININQWIWMHGPKGYSKLYHYGTLGLESPLNLPPPRINSLHWQDGLGNFFIYGGRNGGKYFNDVWEFKTKTNNWVWISGDSTFSLGGHYSQYCSNNDSDYPSDRIMTSAFDAYGSELTYMFGGWNPGVENYGQNDLWSFSPSTKKWTWLSGNNQVYDKGKYGSKGLPDSNNQISARYGHSEWIDASGTLWVYGGLSYDISNAPGSHGGPHPLPCCNLPTKNDLWKFVPDTSCLHISERINVFIPNAFSPNGDGVNDCFTVFSKTTIVEYSIKIFNRWGEIIYSSNDLRDLNDTTRGWDGFYKGVIQEPGIYAYSFICTDTNGYIFSKNGELSLIR